MKYNKNIDRNQAFAFCGKIMNLTEWAEQTGLKRETIAYRIKINGWAIEDALTIPPGGIR